LKTRSSAEDYLETILLLSKKKGLVRSIDIAEELGYSKPSVSVAMKKLKADGMVIVDEYGYINLTGQGLKTASEVYDRHSVVFKLLVSIGVSEEVAEEDACKIEHILSDETFDAIKKKLNS
jgi:Mn-dependent DtxR family transcriptional regulator